MSPVRESVIDKLSHSCDNPLIEAKERVLRSYVTLDGKVPYEDWLADIGDKRTKAVILNRIDRLRLGNFGDCRSVGGGVYELRINFGPGFRVYFGLENKELVLLLCGGDKKTQKQDIANAHEFWMEYKENAN